MNAILNSLTPEDIENLKQTAASVLGGMGDKEPQQKEQRTSEKKQQSRFDCTAIVRKVNTAAGILLRMTNIEWVYSFS